MGLISFSHVLSWLFKRFHDITIAALMGFLIGSLNKIWPWKETLSVRVKHAGKPDEEIVPFIQENVLPGAYSVLNEVETAQLGLTAREPYLMAAIGLALVGFLVIWVLDRFGPKETAE